MCNPVEIYGNIFLVYLNLYYRNKKRKISSWKNKISVESLTLDITHFKNFFISLGVTKSLFHFCINLVIFILVYNLESYGYFQMGIC